MANSNKRKKRTPAARAKQLRRTMRKAYISRYGAEIGEILFQEERILNHKAASWAGTPDPLQRLKERLEQK